MSDLRNDLKEFKKKFAKLLKESKFNKFVVFIDKLGRCSPDTIIETLAAMRLFVFTGNTVFIIGADSDIYRIQLRAGLLKSKQIRLI